MPAPPLFRRDGMTLVELLVVVAIIGLLAVTVLPNVANTTEARRSRESARAVAAVVTKAQSRALGRSEWSGFTMAPIAPASYGAIDLYLADVPPAYRGDTVDATLTVGSSGSPRTAVPSANALQTLATQPIVSPYDLIRFGGHGPYFEVTSAAPTKINFQMRTWSGALTVENAGQTELNTPWPPAGVPLAFEIHRQPVSRSSPTSLTDGRVIDLRWSGCGPRSSGGVTASYRRFTGLSFTPTLIKPYNPIDSTTDQPGSPVTIAFDATGRIRQFLIGSNRYTVTGMIFLLVGRADRAGHTFAVLDPADTSSGANWQYADSFWVAIDTLTGVTKTAECTPNPGSSGLSNQQIYDQLINSQQFVREQFD